MRQANGITLSYDTAVEKSSSIRVGFLSIFSTSKFLEFDGTNDFHAIQCPHVGIGQNPATPVSVQT